MPEEKGKSLFIAEKPSVAREFAAVLGVSGRPSDGFFEDSRYVVTWCVGHLVTMSYPERYDQKYKKWTLEALPFFPDHWLYEILPASAKQFAIVRKQLERADVERIYVCTDAGREGEYIYRLVEMMSDPSVGRKDRRRVWIDSQTEDEIRRGIREAKPLSEYDHLSEAAYLRAKEDYLMGINFSRLLTVKYGNTLSPYRGGKWSAVSVGRVMTCVLGMVVRREREIRCFVKTPFFKVFGLFGNEKGTLRALWHVHDRSRYAGSPALYKENGFRKREDAEELIRILKEVKPQEAEVLSVSRKTEKKYAPLLYNLAEIQNDASRIFRISPDETLSVIQSLYEKKMVTYPRTDARVLSTPVAKEIRKNIAGLSGLAPYAEYVSEILDGNLYAGIEKSRYTNDKQVTDHYALIPTGQGTGAFSSLDARSAGIYDLIVRRFLSIFYPPAEYRRTAAELEMDSERFSASSKELIKEGFLRVANRRQDTAQNTGNSEDDEDTGKASPALLASLKKGMKLPADGFEIKEGETSPPKRYTSGSMILAMENAGQLIEDEELRAQIRGSGIGTSATRAEILKKLFTIDYLSLNKKTQVITPSLLGELVYDTVDLSIRPMLNPELTASWEKGLTYVAEGTVSGDEYMQKLEQFIGKRITAVRALRNEGALRERFASSAAFYKKASPKQRHERRNST